MSRRQRFSRNSAVLAASIVTISGLFDGLSNRFAHHVDPPAPANGAGGGAAGAPAGKTEALREEFGRLHTEATAIVSAAAEAQRALTPEEITAQDRRFSRLDQIKVLLEQDTKLANLAFHKNAVIRVIDPPGRIESDDAAAVAGMLQRFRAKRVTEDDRQEFGRAFNEWARTGQLPQKFATITTSTQSGAFLPRMVAPPLTPTAMNAFREAFLAYGFPVLSTETTEDLSLPVLDAAAGGVVAENASSETENAPATSESILLHVSTYQSGSTYFSNQQLAAVDFDLFNSTLPVLQYSKELALENAIAAAVIDDSNITQQVITSGATGFSFANLTKLNRSLPRRFDKLKFMVLSQTAFQAAEALTDSVGRPILVPDAQNDSLMRFMGTPVMRCDGLPAFTAGNVIGILGSLLGFRLRDAAGVNIARYTNYPPRPNQTGYNLFAYHAWGYAPAAMATLKAAAS